jgi:hypothetical protein
MAILLLIRLGLPVPGSRSGDPARTSFPSGSVSLASRIPHGQSSATAPGRDDAVDILDVEIHMGDRAAVEAVLGQAQLRRAAPQPHIQRPVRPEDVLRFDFEPELGVPLTGCSPVSYVQDRGHALHRSP